MGRTSLRTPSSAIIPFLLLFLLATPASGLAQSTDTEVGVDEHLGEYIPLDITVTAANGDQFTLGDFIDRPTVLILAYYRCPDICTPLMRGMVDVLQRMDLMPGEDFKVITVGFDPRETTMDALHSHDHMMGMFRTELPENTWRFTVTDSASIDRLTDAVGFRYVRRGEDFDHPALLTMLSEEGMIARYLYGITFLPFDLKLAVSEAAQGKVGATLNRILLYCFSYDPEGQTYVFNILKVTGTLIMFFAVIFVLWLVLSGRRRRGGEEEEQETSGGAPVTPAGEGTAPEPAEDTAGSTEDAAGALPTAEIPEEDPGDETIRDEEI
ncbi:SCO family protein [Gemmatimonadota bacterium]